MRWDMALFFLPGLTIGLTLHEFAHAWSASLLGDDFARRQGRVSLNPFRHLSLLGTLAIFVLPIGWAKPVMVNLYNFKHPKRDYLITSLAGPAANFLVVAACIGLMLFTRHSYRYGTTGSAFMELGHLLLTLTAVINTILAAINLLPIPPLDGSKIWPCIVPGLKPSFKPKTMWMFIALLLVLVQTNSLRPIIGGAVAGLQRIMPVSDVTIFGERHYAGVVAMAQKDYATAEGRFTEALAINPDSHSALAFRARARLRLADPQGALDDLNEAIGRCPREPVYYDSRADALDALGRTAEAQADREMAQRLWGTDLPPQTESTSQPAADRTPPR